MREGGFTLIEVLLAVALFALIGVAGNVLLAQMININERSDGHASELAQLQRAVRAIERDSFQLVPRAVRDELGDRRYALSGGVDWLVEFTRAGWRNPLDQNRAELQRVSYHFEDASLVRYYWPVLDRAEDSASIKQIMLTDLEGATVEFLNDSGDSSSFWPPGNNDAGDANELPRAMLWRIQSKRYGEIQRLIPLPQVAKASQDNREDSNGGEQANDGAGEPNEDTLPREPLAPPPNESPIEPLREFG